MCAGAGIILWMYSSEHVDFSSDSVYLLLVTATSVPVIASLAFLAWCGIEFFVNN